jgi:hypothetical protein
VSRSEWPNPFCGRLDCLRVHEHDHERDSEEEGEGEPDEIPPAYVSAAGSEQRPQAAP